MNWKIPYFRHDLGQVKLDSLAGVLEGDILTTGEAVSAFEAKFASHLGQRHAFAVTSCTGALHLALLALDIGPGDEVITTPMSFIATATAILEAGATPVFVDVEAGYRQSRSASGRSRDHPRTKAIMPVHLYGLMCDMRASGRSRTATACTSSKMPPIASKAMRDGVRPGELVRCGVLQLLRHQEPDLRRRRCASP